jgi:hypothetical protein
MSTAEERLVSGRAWHDFLDVLRICGDAIDDMDDDITDLDRAEWYRCVTRVMRVACERYLENSEPYRPRLRITPWRTSINVQSPDQDHLLCEFVDTTQTYRITGNRGGVNYFIIAALTSPRPPDPGAVDWAAAGFDALGMFDPSKSQAIASIASDEIAFAADGSFAVTVSAAPVEGSDWLPLRDDCVGLLVRTVHHDREVEATPSFAIAVVDGEQLRPCRPDEIAEGLAKAGQMVLGFVNRFREWKRDLSVSPNQLEFSRERYLTHGGVADREFAFGVWRKPEGHALVIEFEPPECEYWNFQVCNIWQENLDNYEDSQGYTTKFTARTEPDGRVRIVVADRDPGLGGNWVDCFGHTSGLMGLRFIKTAPPPDVQIRLLAIS